MENNEIINILRARGLEKLANDPRMLLKYFSEDSLFFKQVLKEIILLRIRGVLNDCIQYTDPVEKHFPRKTRYFLTKDVEDKTSIKFPPMTLAKGRMRLLLFSSLLMMVFILAIIFNKIEFLLIPLDLFGITFYFFIILTPAIIFSIFMPTFFSRLDWPNVITINDLIRDMTVTNTKLYQKDNYSKIFEELVNLLPSVIKSS